MLFATFPPPGSPHRSVFLLLGGLSLPLSCAAAGTVYNVGRYYYAKGYYAGNPHRGLWGCTFFTPTPVGFLRMPPARAVRVHRVASYTCQKCSHDTDFAICPTVLCGHKPMLWTSAPRCLTWSQCLGCFTCSGHQPSRPTRLFFLREDSHLCRDDRHGPSRTSSPTAMWAAWARESRPNSRGGAAADYLVSVRLPHLANHGAPLFCAVRGVACFDSTYGSTGALFAPASQAARACPFFWQTH